MKFDPTKFGAVPVSQGNGFDASKFGATPANQSLADKIWSNAASNVKKDPTSGASTGLMTGPLSVLAVPGQLAGKAIAETITKPSRENIGDNIQIMRGIADSFLKLSDKETDPAKKLELIKKAQDVATEMKSSGAMVDELNNEIINRQKIETPIGNIPALSNDPLRAGQQVSGRGIQTVAVTAPQLGPSGAGVMLGLGNAVESGDNLQDTALKTAGGAVAGKVLGTVTNKLFSTQVGQKILSSPFIQTIGKAFSPLQATEAPAGTIGATVDSAFKTFGDLTDKVVSPSTYLKPVKTAAQSVGVLKTTEQKVASSQNKIQKYWEDAKSRYQATTRFDKNSPSILAREGIIPEGKGGAMVTGPQADLLHAKATGERETLNSLLESTGKYGNLDSAKNTTIKYIEENFKGIEREAALARFEKDFELRVRDMGQKVVESADGDRLIPLHELNNVKSDYWGSGYVNKLAPQSDQINAKVSRLAGNAMKSQIETSAGDIADQSAKDAVIALNNRLGELYQAETFLREMNGKRLPFGMMGRYFARTAGAIVGSSGGPIGSTVGMITADKLVDVFQNPKYSVGEAAAIIARAKKEAPEALRQAEEMIKNNLTQRATRLGLPSPSSIQLGQVGGGTPGPNYNLPNESSLGSP